MACTTTRSSCCWRKALRRPKGQEEHEGDASLGSYHLCLLIYCIDEYCLFVDFFVEEIFLGSIVMGLRLADENRRRI